ncbi:MAG TPA: bifunctional enoyl-CoA hydratase/phosphate acetyltransferase [Bryobacteraceae bacterium]
MTPIRNFDELLEAAAQVRGPRVLVVFPTNEETFRAIRDARAKLGLEFLLVGDGKRIRTALPEFAGAEIVDRPNLADSVDHSMELISKGAAGILMKGSIDTGTLMKTVMRAETGVRTGRLLSDVFVFEYAQRPANRLVMITDGGLNVTPDLAAKAELIRNAVEVAHALGNSVPKVAVLAATEFVQANMPATLDAAALSKMNERGQIRGCVVEGPLALDGALAPCAAEEKQIGSAVAGAAEILVCPNIECANMLAKSMVYVGNARLGHVIVGGRIPILIPSRADQSDAKLLSLALGVVMSAPAAE